MPSFQTWGPVAHNSRLPPTPPEYQIAYPTPTTAMSDQSYYSSHSYQPRHGQSGRDFIDQYSQAPAYAAQQALTAQLQPRYAQQQAARDYRQVPSYASHMPTQYPYGAVAAPILPPIRCQDPLDPITAQYVHARPEPKAKEEKPTGGVAAHLDYDMDLMASFVAEMAQKMYAICTSGLYAPDVDLMRSVAPGAAPTAQFRKYVSQILSSTRLPSSTIMLGMFYLARRMQIVSERGEDTRSSGMVYRMLTTCLLLGSKFLDDNTFQNRSWAEVSSIPVHDLNTMELQWLEDFNWKIHKPMYDQGDGFFIWIDEWHKYEKKAEIAQAKENSKLAPINTNIRVSQHYQQPLMSPEGPIPPQYQRASQYDTQWVRPLISDYSPPSAPHSGPATPDYYNNATWGYSQAPPAYSSHAWNPNSSAYASQRSQPPSYQHTPSYPQQYAQVGWGSHGSTCACTLCVRHTDHFFGHRAYGLQSVAG